MMQNVRQNKINGCCKIMQWYPWPAARLENCVNAKVGLLSKKYLFKVDCSKYKYEIISALHYYIHDDSGTLVQAYRLDEHTHEI